MSRNLWSKPRKFREVFFLKEWEKLIALLDLPFKHGVSTLLCFWKLSCLLHNKLCSSKMHHNVVNVIQTIVLFSSSHHHTGVPWRPRPSSPSTSPRPQWSSPARGSHDIRKSLSPSAWVRLSPGRSQQWFRQKISEKNWANIFESDLKWFIFFLCWKDIKIYFQTNVWKKYFEVNAVIR